MEIGRTGSCTGTFKSLTFSGGAVPSFLPAVTAVPFLAAALVAVDIVDVTDRTEDAVDTGLFTVAGLSLLWSKGGSGGRFVGVARDTPLFVDPVDVFLTRAGAAPARVGVARPLPAGFPRTLILDVAEDVEDIRARGPPNVELAVRKVVEPSVVVDKLEVGRDDAVEAREVVRETGEGAVPRFPLILLPALLFRIVDA